MSQSTVISVDVSTFYAALEGANHVSLPQIELDVADGHVDLSDVAEDQLGAVQAELNELVRGLEELPAAVVGSSSESDTGEEDNEQAPWSAGSND